ncbi:hypothetical protein [Bradyrhizobium sp. BWA-3-5]|uniref:hypothetical protein n=1 Tax=Bradyrhizobium sp. BWA-3-5 TaxID=3080013 RepID=UPI00293E68F7|nr:hypothetical protein [Bradyrhizobium sp. BWA-3-5]WOH63673.1 hypothetical protein RX331_23505 [Bradyrhizobium sp. BWA-3-5]
MNVTEGNLSFEADIKDLFRARDVAAMKNVADLDLHDYEDVKENAQKILDRLQAGTMPCDGAWPNSKVDKFAMWKEQGMNP